MSSSSCWSEVLSAKSENRRELNIQGMDINRRIKENGLDNSIFTLSNLNLLKIAGTPLTRISEDIGKLTQLTALTLENNQLEELPSSIGNLCNLKFLDISGNNLQTLPNDICNLINLQSLNANLNSLIQFPNVSGMKSLAYLSVSRNNLSSLPEGVCDTNLKLLSTIDAAHNEIESIPPEISQLTHLIKLDVSHNKLDTLPLELSECPKLKEVYIFENKMKDRKFLKLAEHSTKALLTHLSALLDKQRVAQGGDKSKKGKSKKKKIGGKSDIEELPLDVMHILKFEDGLTVSVTQRALTVRPFIVCCIIRNIDFGKSNNMFKRFIDIQTKLHDSLCEKRQAATIATHDLHLVKGPLVYDAASPSTLMIIPLFKKKETSAETLIKDLRSEAEALRKEKKRSTVSGIHKYLDLLKDKTEYPCLKDAEGDCISLPPITNSDKTKICKETTDILVEVTGCKNLAVCKSVMEQLLISTLITGVGTCHQEGDKSTEVAGESRQEEVASAAAVKTKESLTVEQVKIVDHEGQLRVLYPARDDLLNPAFDVIRNYD